MSQAQIRILHVLNELRPSGAETMLRSCAPSWRAHGCVCDILSLGATEGPYAGAIRSAGYTVYHLPFKRSLPFFFAFSKEIKRNKYDVIHLHAERAHFLLSVACMLAGYRKIIRTVHSTFASEGMMGKVRMVMRGTVRRLLVGCGVRYVAISAGVQKIERDCFGIPTRIISNWFDSSSFIPPTEEQRRVARAMYGYTDSDFVLITIGNCSNVKNHGALIEAIAKSAQIPNIKYLHIGLEDATHSERQHATHLGVLERINFAGSSSEVAKALHAADVYVMPSLKEGFGIAALEALATGLPAILADVPGLRDFSNVFSHISYVSPDSDALAGAIKKMAELTPQQRSEYGKNNLKIAVELFSIEQGVEQYVAQYRS